MTLVPLRILVVDASAYHRRSIADFLSGRDDIQVVGKAGDGEEALRLVSLLEPGLITLDLEMPRMDGFTFLRQLMAKPPTPVIVVSEHGSAKIIDRARELGAFDFVVKPERQIGCDAAFRGEILSKVLRVRESHPPKVWTPKVTSHLSEEAAVHIPTPEEAAMMRQVPAKFREIWLLRRRAASRLRPGRRDPPPAAAAAPVPAPAPAPPSLVDAVDEPED